MKKYDKDNRPAGLHTSLPSDSFDPEKYLKDITKLRKQLGLDELPVPSAPHVPNADPHFDHVLSKPPGSVEPVHAPPPKKKTPDSEFGEIYDAEDTNLEELRSKLGISLPDASLRAIHNQLHKDANKDADDQLAQYEREQAEISDEEEAFVDDLIDSVKEPQTEKPQAQEHQTEEHSETSEELAKPTPTSEALQGQHVSAEKETPSEKEFSISVDEEEADELPPLPEDIPTEALDYSQNDAPRETVQQDAQPEPKQKAPEVQARSEGQPDPAPQQAISSSPPVPAHDQATTVPSPNTSPAPQEKQASSPMNWQQAPEDQEPAKHTSEKQLSSSAQELKPASPQESQQEPARKDAQKQTEEFTAPSVAPSQKASPAPQQEPPSDAQATTIPTEGLGNLDLDDEPISREEPGSDEWIEESAVIDKVLAGTTNGPPAQALPSQEQAPQEPKATPPPEPSPTQAAPPQEAAQEEPTPAPLQNQDNPNTDVEEQKADDPEAYVDEHIDRINKDLRRLHKGEDLYQEKLIHLKEGILRCRNVLKQGHALQAKRYYNVLSQLFNSLSRNDPQRQKWIGVITKLYDDIAEQS